MSTTHEFNISLEATVVTGQESVDGLKVARAAVKAAAETKAGRAKLEGLRGDKKYLNELFRSDKSDEEVIIQIIRNGLRQVIGELASEASDSDQTVRFGNISVKVRDPLCTMCEMTRLSQQKGFKRETCPYRKCGGIK